MNQNEKIVRFVDNVYAICGFKYINIAELEKEMRVAGGTIKRWKNGSIKDVKLTQALAISDKLGFTINELCDSEFGVIVKE